MSFMRKMVAFVGRDFRQESSYRLHFTFQPASILVNTLAYYYLAAFAGASMAEKLEPYGGDFFAFLLLGVGLWGYQNVALTSLTAKIREAQMQGTLEALLSTRTPPNQIILGSTAYDFVLMSARVVLYVLFGWLIFGLDLGKANYGGALVVMLVAIAAFLGIGIASGGFTLMFKKGDPVTWVFTALAVPLGGVLYPVDSLPGFLQPLSAVLPITHALEALRRTLLDGATLMEVRSSLGALILFAGLVLPLSLVWFRIALRQSKVRGGLVQF